MFLDGLAGLFDRPVKSLWLTKYENFVLSGTDMSMTIIQLKDKKYLCGQKTNQFSHAELLFSRY